MTDAIVTCDLCNTPFPQYMAACPNCGAYKTARTQEEVAATGPPAKMSALAVTGFVLSLTIWWMLFIGPFAALIVSAIAWQRTRNVANRLNGKGFAIAGTIISALTLALTIFVFIIAPMIWGETSTDEDGTIHWSIGDAPPDEAETTDDPGMDPVEPR